MIDFLMRYPAMTTTLLLVAATIVTVLVVVACFSIKPDVGEDD